MDFNFARLDLFVSVLAEGPAPEPVSPNEHTIPQISQMLHRALLDAPQVLRCSMKLESGAPLRLVWVATGDTAGVAYWMQDERVTAVSIVMSGIDPAEDLAAIQVVMSAIPSAIPQAGVDAILQAPHPLLVGLYSTAEAMQDVAISTGAVSLAIAFFGMLGITSVSESKSQ